MDAELKAQAEALLENGDVETLYALISPFLQAKDPYAQLLYSSFSLESMNESDEAFEQRSVELLKLASEGGLAEASYRLGVLFLYGDLATEGDGQSSFYFERAIAQGHSHSKFTYGFNLYYGAGQTPQDKTRGLLLLKEAAEEGIELAAEELKIIYSGSH